MKVGKLFLKVVLGLLNLVQ